MRICKQVVSTVLILALLLTGFTPVLAAENGTTESDYEIEIFEKDEGMFMEMKTSEFTIDYNNVDGEVMTLTTLNGLEIAVKAGLENGMIEIEKNEMPMDFNGMQSIQNLSEHIKEIGLPYLETSFNLAMEGYELAGIFINSHKGMDKLKIGDMFSVVVTEFWKYKFLNDLDVFALGLQEAIENDESFEIVVIDTTSLYSLALTTGFRGLTLVNALQHRANLMIEQAMKSYNETKKRLAIQRTERMERLEKAYEENARYTNNYHSANNTLKWAIDKQDNVILIKNARENIDKVEDPVFKSELLNRWNEHFNENMIERLEWESSTVYKEAVISLNSTKKYKLASYFDLSYAKIMNIPYEPLKQELLAEWQVLYDENLDLIEYEKAKKSFAYTNARAKLQFAVKHGIKSSINSSYQAIIAIENEQLRNELLEEWESHFGNN